ncbi:MULTISPECIES: hypothetical protein [unclassified Paenibacillus]|uniref:hypothetical protein n=1 Tax=unclassified Paenibacillus TaxID=185978 RepID=UPI00020D7856|nr:MULTISPECIES: hypothetical protein [unclassified Paenibacillus]EGL19849.1 hypothetical protein HMPREF9413_4826 [Paenibacillus sp. HGF7]EPD81316.1 hypothetical protein HMPREF1207_05073 [Paenibacillus sp. HGH0039]
MKYPIGLKMTWLFADNPEDIYVIDGYTQDDKYIVYVADKNGVRYAAQKTLVTENQLDELIVTIIAI